MTRIPLFLKKIIQFPVEAYFGRFVHWQQHRKTLKSIPSIPMAIDLIQERWPMPLNDTLENPIFIFSAGWRSGSTLIQRLVNSSGNALIWGEPYANSDYLGKLSESLRIFRTGLPPDNFFLDHLEKTDGIKTYDKWIAHLYPNPSNLREAHREFFRTLFAKPAFERGFSRWGFKETRYEIDHAIYLKWLFSKAQFLFLYRNPYHVWRSLRLFGGFNPWPQEPIFTAKKFGRLWRILLEGYLKNRPKVDGFIVRYEDLCEGRLPLTSLSQFLNLDLRKEVLNINVSGRGHRSLQPIPSTELRILRKAVEPLASKLGYTPD